MPAPTPLRTFAEYVAAYEPTGAHNDALWREFTDRLHEVPLLERHRLWVEEHKHGYGDRAFHYLWYLLLRDEILPRAAPALLEIGVYKGQVISLWSALATALGARARTTIAAVTPLADARIARRPWGVHHLLRLFSPRYRDEVESGNQTYEADDYPAAVRAIFGAFGESFDAVELHRGFSDDPTVVQALAHRRFDLVYVDGGHRYEEAAHDIRTYGALIQPGGYLVLDDAATEQPGTAFWKGLPAVSRAAEEIDRASWENVLNVGHNRVYRRRRASAS